VPYGQKISRHWATPRVENANLTVRPRRPTLIRIAALLPCCALLHIVDNCPFAVIIRVLVEVRGGKRVASSVADYATALLQAGM
jgi:hypothetical protein